MGLHLSGSTALPKVAATVSASGAAVVNKHNPVDASGAIRSISLPTGQSEGTQISVEKIDSSANQVNVTGSIRGAGSSTLPLAWQYESIVFRADSAGSWWPVAGHKTKAALDTAYGLRNPLGLTGYYVVGTRPPTAFTGSGNGNVGQNGRLKDYLACDVTDLRLFYSAPLTLELDGRTNTVTTEAGLEVPLGGTIYPATFGGRQLGTFDANGFCVSDPIPGPFSKGPVYPRTLSSTLTAASGTWNTTNGSNVVTVATITYGDYTAFRKGAFIFGTGVTGFANTITDVSVNGSTMTLTLAAAASSTQTGATFYTNLGQGQVTHSGYSDASEYGGASTAPNVNLSKSGTITPASGNTTGPTLILGRLPKGATPPPCVALIGDSNTAGTGYTNTDYASRAGTSFATIGMSAGGASLNYDTPFINFGKGGETGATFSATANSWRRRKLLAYCSHALVLEGTNDLGLNVSLATLQATLTSIWTQLANLGIKVWGCTIPPQTSSTDTWATTGNQTAKLSTATELVRTQTNDWIRTKPSVLSGYFDVADALETSRNSGIWKVGLVYTSDGLGVHMNNAGHAAAGAVVDRTVFV